MWKENRFGWPLRGIIWFTLAIAGSCAVIALLAGYGAAIIDTSAVSTPTNSGRTRWRRSNNKIARCRLRPGYSIHRKLQYQVVGPCQILSEYASRQSWVGRVADHRFRQLCRFAGP